MTAWKNLLPYTGVDKHFFLSHLIILFIYFEDYFKSSFFSVEEDEEGQSAGALEMIPLDDNDHHLYSSSDQSDTSDQNNQEARLIGEMNDAESLRYSILRHYNDLYIPRRVIVLTLLFIAEV